MEPTENRLFDLLETYSFAALTEEDRLFVLSNMTEEEFRVQQKVLVAADQLVYPQAVPLPLALPAKKSGGLMTPIPLYKSLISAAAAAMFIFFFWPKEQEGEKIVYLDKYSPADTIYKTKIVHDTVFKEKGGTLLAVNQKNPDTIYLYQENPSTAVAPRMLNATQSIPLPELNQALLKNRGKSLKEDNHSSLLPAISEFER